MAKLIDFRQSRRRTLRALGAGAALALPCMRPSWADTYPSKPIRVVLPYPAGGPADYLARLVARELAARLGVAVVIDNVAGANGVIGSAAVAKAAPDGYTLLFAQSGPIAISPHVLKRIPYDPIKDFAPITQIVAGQSVLVVREGIPVKTVQDLVAYAKQNPGKLTYGSAGLASTNHLTGELFQLLAGIKLLHIPYKGAAPILQDLLAGTIDMSFMTITVAQPHFASGKLRPLAVATRKRALSAPDLPSLSELYPDFEADNWFGLMAPGATPRPIIDRLHAEVTAVLKSPSLTEPLGKDGLVILATTPEQFASAIREDLVRFARLIKLAGITAE